jgi:hypothetical protein
MQLTDTQLVVLAAALGREDGLILPLPATLKGGAVAKVCSALLAKGLAEEAALSRKEAQAAPETVFRTAEDDKPVTLRITALGRKAINGDAAEEPADEPATAPKKKAARRAAKAAHDAPQAAAPAAREEKPDRARNPEASAGNQPRAGTKLAELIELLRRPAGVSIAEASAALDWMKHSVRGAVAGALKKKYGLTILAEKVEGRGTVYRIGGSAG